MEDQLEGGETLLGDVIFQDDVEHRCTHLEGGMEGSALATTLASLLRAKIGMHSGLGNSVDLLQGLCHIYAACYLSMLPPQETPIYAEP
jgi:hypothetical protein